MKNRAVLNTVAVATSKRATVIGVRHVGPASSFVRRVAAALALLLCAAPVLGTFHYATVAHVACPEDGELIDVPANAGGSRTAVANHSHQDGPTLLAQREPVPASFGASSHEHCAVALQALARRHPDTLFVTLRVGEPVIPDPWSRFRGPAWKD